MTTTTIPGPWPPAPDATSPTKPRLLDRVRDAVQTRHYSIRTEEAYVGWIRRYILFHGKRHPQEMGEPEINAFLTHLAVAQRVGPSTQTQVLSALDATAGSRFRRRSARRWRLLYPA
jgi:hypothetical protein